MDEFDRQHIEVEPFDREYGLDELLPLNTLENLCSDAASILPVLFAVCRQGGRFYFQFGAWTNSLSDTLSKALSESRPEKDCMIQAPDGEPILIFPLLHELEPKGYVALPTSGGDRDELSAAGQAGRRVLQLLMHMRHQNMLTSGLHGMVVTESYAQLKDKAEQLARSEEKYRHLASHLEIEVQKKTAEIRTAHAHMLHQEKLAAIGQLAAGMAHEINNPLGFISSNLSTLKAYAEDLTTLTTQYRQLKNMLEGSPHGDCGPAVQSRIQAITGLESKLDIDFIANDMPALLHESTDGAARIQKIVQDLKTVARPGETKSEAINIHQSIDAVLTIVHNRIVEAVSIVKEFGPVPLVTGHAQELNQVWLNLILNAIDAVDGRGTITLITRAEKGQVCIVVKDDGRGIQPEHLPKVFDPFFTTKEVGRGTGLGLHLVYHLVCKHNGRIQVDSQVGQGSTFTVHLPADEGK